MDKHIFGTGKNNSFFPHATGIIYVLPKKSPAINGRALIIRGLRVHVPF
jgi:hypothetical protein